MPPGKPTREEANSGTLGGGRGGNGPSGHHWALSASGHGGGAGGDRKGVMLALLRGTEKFAIALAYAKNTKEMKTVSVSYESPVLPSPQLRSPANYFSLGTARILPWVWRRLAREHHWAAGQARRMPSLQRCFSIINLPSF